MVIEWSGKQKLFVINILIYRMKLLFDHFSKSELLVAETSWIQKKFFVHTYVRNLEKCFFFVVRLNN